MNPHAAMTVSALVQREHVFVRRIVLINQKFIGEIEANPAERVALPGG